MNSAIEPNDDNALPIRVLLIDDEAPVRKAASQWLSLADMQVESFGHAREALKIIDADLNAVIVSDIKMPEIDGMELARRCVAIDADLPVILVTAHGDIGMAVQAMRDGVYDFIEKPYQPELLIDRIQRAWNKRQLVLENRALRRMVDRGASLEGQLIGRSPAMRRFRQQLLQVAETSVDVVINGPTGAGKELVSRCLHDWSKRAEGPFVAVNCGAIPENLFESELFGHEAGAFTGATGKRVGKLEFANGGTLFLDEIESMPMLFQIKLLRVLQERKLERLGSNKEIPLDIRVIAATKVDLRQASDRGEFREDLYYRFNVAEMHLPALKQRAEDVPLLFEHYARKAAYQYEKEYQPPSDEDMAVLCGYPWPGNVRELKNMAERFVLGIGTGGSISALLRDGRTPAPQASASLAERVQAFERALIVQSLQRNNSSIQATMDELDLPRRTLNNKMLQYGI
ncbi:MAG: sigma-54-dependent transcriptional regulator, partial [Gammaproteobacteria bacterium]